MPLAITGRHPPGARRFARRAGRDPRRIGLGWTREGAQGGPPARGSDAPERRRHGRIRLLERALLVALGGAIGSVLRYLASLVAAHWLGAEFPYGTLIVNAAGSFAIGVIQQVGTDALLLPDSTRLFLTTGLMGGLTTYSTFSYETVRLMETDAWHHAWINVAATTILALGLCFLGMATGRLVLHLRG
jgi:CrcB protein